MSLKKNVFFTAFAQIPVLVLGVISGVFIARILGPAGKGVYAMFQANIELFVLFVSFGLKSGFVYYLSSKKLPLSKILPIMIVAFFVSVSVILLSLFFLDAFGLIDIFFPKEYVSFFYMAYFFLLCIVSLGIGNFASIFQGHKIFRRFNQMQVINSILNFLAIGLLFFCYWKGFFAVGIKEIFIAGLIVVFVVAIMWLIAFVKQFDLKLEFNISYVKEIKPLFIFVFLTYLGDMLAFLNYRLDIWIVHAYTTEYQLGLYALAAGLAQMFWFISNPIATVLFPYLSGKRDSEALTNFTFFSRLNFSSILILMIIAFMVVDYIIPTLYGKEFSHSILPFKILLFGILANCVVKIFAHYIYALGAVKYNIYATLAGLIITVILDLVLIPKHGIIGASIASSIAYFCVFILTSYFLFFKLRIPIKNYFLFSITDLKEVYSSFIQKSFNK